MAKKEKTEQKDYDGRKQKKGRASTQKYLPFSEIKNDVLLMKDGSMRGVMLVSSVNFALKSEQEQEALVQGYVQFLNSFDFPMQIIIQSRKLRIEEYLDRLKAIEKKQENELLRMQTSEYRRYVAELVELGDIMTKRFYLVVPYHPSADSEKSFISRILNVLNPVSTIRLSGERFRNQKRELMKRVDHVTSALNSMGLNAVSLNTQALIELYYNTYNPHVSLNQPMVDIDNLLID